jgi:hypothetical protein
VKDTATEAATQKLIVDALRLMGFVVLETSRRRKRCWSCGAWPKGGDGVSKGVPDLLVFLRGPWLWLGLEVKGPATRLSPEQRALAAAGMTVVVRTPEEALAAVREREA